MNLEQALERIAELEAQLEKKNWFASCSCLQKRKNTKPGNHHYMYCRNYVGKLEHNMRYDRTNPSFGGSDYSCSCGGYFRQGGYFGHDMDEPVVCPRADQDWRGPKKDK